MMAGTLVLSVGLLRDPLPPLAGQDFSKVPEGEKEDGVSFAADSLALCEWSYTGFGCFCVVSLEGW